SVTTASGGDAMASSAPVVASGASSTSQPCSRSFEPMSVRALGLSSMRMIRCTISLSLTRPRDEVQEAEVNGAVIAVLGTGTMGQGIAQVAATTGHPTRLFDAAPGRAKSAVEAILAQLDKLVAKGKITKDARDLAASRLTPVANVSAACEGCALVIEAVPE